MLSSYVYQYPGTQYYQPPFPTYPKRPGSYPETYSKYRPPTSFAYQQEPKPYIYQNLAKQNTPCPKQSPKSTLDYSESKPCQKPVQIPDDPLTIEDKRKSRRDPNVLNNLAIALQLLIVSNIISNPPDLTDTFKSIEKYNAYKSEVNKLDEQLNNLSDAYNKEYSNKMPLQSLFETNASELQRAMPNSKFLGDSGMMDYSFPKSLPARASGLKSPYEAINTFEGPQFVKNDFQNPYSAMTAFDNNKELFSMSDLF